VHEDIAAHNQRAGVRVEIAERYGQAICVTSKPTCRTRKLWSASSSAPFGTDNIRPKVIDYMNLTWIVMILVAASTIVGLMGTDLVLPAVPALPEALAGSASTAQLVLSAYVAGTCVGLLAFGALSDRVSTHRLFLGSLVLTAILSLACATAHSIEVLVAYRALQGAAAAGPAVFAPALIRATLPSEQAVRALGLVGSVESLAPALAAALGAALLTVGSWQLSFHALAVLAAVLAVAISVCGPLPQTSRRNEGSYARLLRDTAFLRYALSQAFVLGGLLVFVLGMPAVFVRVLGGTVNDFITMQVLGIPTFIVAANLSGRVVARYGAEGVITAGTCLATGALAQLCYALAGGSSTLVITVLLLPVNIGLGLRGPPGFYRAVLAAHSDDARGSALVVLFILGVTAGGTALGSPWIESGTVPLAALTLLLELAAIACLAALPRLAQASASEVGATRALQRRHH
jgi:DHA1 family bicyclomycin/chloramphenicol resistance-like MFS transporter